jgi:hypothetical protein
MCMCTRIRIASSLSDLFTTSCSPHHSGLCQFMITLFTRDRAFLKAQNTNTQIALGWWLILAWDRGGPQNRVQWLGRVIVQASTDNLGVTLLSPSLHSQMGHLLSPTGPWIWGELTGVSGCSPGGGGFCWVCAWCSGWSPSCLCSFSGRVISCWLNIPLVPVGLHIHEYLLLKDVDLGKVWGFDMHFWQLFCPMRSCQNHCLIFLIHVHSKGFLVLWWILCGSCSEDRHIIKIRLSCPLDSLHNSSF